MPLPSSPLVCLALAHARAGRRVLPRPARSIDTPGTFFYGKVTKDKSKHKVPSVECKFFDDNSIYWCAPAGRAGCRS